MNKLKKSFGNIFPQAGCDEAGRGCLAGPVVAAAVILKKNITIENLNDSKKLTLKERNQLRDVIMDNALAWAVAFIDNHQIDKMNILNASILAMHHAMEKLNIQPAFVLVDGNRFKPYKDIPYECIVKGDGKYLNIAAASVLAKTARDDFMLKIHNEFPHYNWHKNKGYPTMEHKLAIHKYGLTEYHRKTFSSSIQMKLF